MATSPPSASPIMLSMGDARSASAFAQRMGFGVLAHILPPDAAQYRERWTNMDKYSSNGSSDDASPRK